MGAQDYKEDPEALELAQATFNEQAIYQDLARFSLDWFALNNRSPKVLDLCSATGLSALQVAKTIPVASVTLVDIDKKALDKGCQYFASFCPCFVHCNDAVTFHSVERYDIILMNSAYHHIQDKKKLLFLKNASALLNTDGVIFIGDHFLPDYFNLFQFKKSVVLFYTKLINELIDRGESEIPINVIRRSGLYNYQSDYEYKVSFSVFSEHVTSSGLLLNEINKIWPEKSYSGNFGTFTISVTH